MVVLTAGCDKKKSVKEPSGMPRTAMTISGEEFELELAINEVDRARGFMYREACQRNEGILFIFPEARLRTFHMNNCLFDLDGIFIGPDDRIINIEYMRFPRSGSSELYRSQRPAKYVLELKAGRAGALGLRPGDKLEFPEAIKAMAVE
ncbi:MAG: DUF192 domain-containing protein [Sedimentisphaerales bacterium]|nr:DUF192 domain-containing protein [Sedimentisphaerales bacterium]